MFRKIAVPLIALLALGLLAGASLAATGSLSSSDRKPDVDLPDLPDAAPDGVPFGLTGEDPPGSEKDGGDDDGDGDVDAAGLEGEGDADEGDADEGDADEGDADNFGLIRSEEVRQFGACMEETGGDRDACDEFHPRPATETPGHPGRGDNGDNGDNGGPPEETPPAHAGPPEEIPPAHAGPPEHSGAPEGAGPPDHAGPPEGKGPRG